MQKTRDTNLEFNASGDAPCVCRLRVYESPDKPTIVLFIELPRNRGPRIREVIAELATEVYAQLEPPEQGVLWIEHQVPGEDVEEAETWHLVTMTQTEEGFVHPQRWPLEGVRLAALIGEPLETICQDAPKRQTARPG